LVTRRGLATLAPRKERMMDDDDTTYSLYAPDVVEIRRGVVTFRINRKYLQTAIDNIRRNRNAYKTQQAYTTELAAYENALLFLNAQAAPVE
jgi:hypothetical protein